MSIYDGTNKVRDIKSGGHQVNFVYQGNNLIWRRSLKYDWPTPKPSGAPVNILVKTVAGSSLPHVNDLVDPASSNYRNGGAWVVDLIAPDVYQITSSWNCHTLRLVLRNLEHVKFIKANQVVDMAGAFSGARNLETIEFNMGSSSLRNFNAEFTNCPKLRAVMIHPEEMKNVESWYTTFESGVNLEYVTGIDTRKAHTNTSNFNFPWKNIFYPNSKIIRPSLGEQALLMEHINNVQHIGGSVFKMDADTLKTFPDNQLMSSEWKAIFTKSKMPNGIAMVNIRKLYFIDGDGNVIKTLATGETSSSSPLYGTSWGWKAFDDDINTLFGAYNGGNRPYLSRTFNTPINVSGIRIYNSPNNEERSPIEVELWCKNASNAWVKQSTIQSPTPDWTINEGRTFLTLQ